MSGDRSPDTLTGEPHGKLDTEAVAGSGDTLTRYVDHVEARLEVLGRLLAMGQPSLEPELCREAPWGHAVPWVDQLLALEAGQGLRVLDELTRLGLLKADLHNKVNVCPRCRNCQLNFREMCETCESLRVKVEHLILHYRCAFNGLESEYRQGFDLVCPKCRRVLNQLGQDFDRPHQTYVCQDCGSLADEPRLEAQCLTCGHTCSGPEVDVQSIHQYRPTPLTVRAVELQRLTGLDLAEVMFDSQVGLVTREFLRIQAEREFARLQRYGTPVAAALLSWERHGRVCRLFDEWPAEDVRQLGALITGSLRKLDLVASGSRSSIVLLLPETDEAGITVLRRRFARQLGGLQVGPTQERGYEVSWRHAVWTDTGSQIEELDQFMDSVQEEIGEVLEDNEAPELLEPDGSLPAWMNEDLVVEPMEPEQIPELPEEEEPDDPSLVDSFDRLLERLEEDDDQDPGDETDPPDGAG